MVRPKRFSWVPCAPLMATVFTRGERERESLEFLLPIGSKCPMAKKRKQEKGRELLWVYQWSMHHMMQSHWNHHSKGNEGAWPLFFIPSADIKRRMGCG